jgi:hypothetical protein
VCSSHAARRYAAVRSIARWEAGEAQQLPRMTVSKRAADQDHVDEVQHRIALLERGQSEMACPLDGADQCSGRSAKTNTASICRYRRKLWLVLIETACAWKAFLGATTFDECVQSIRLALRLEGRSSKSCTRSANAPNTSLLCVRSRLANERCPPHKRCAADWSGHRSALWPHRKSIFVSDTALRQWCAAQ